MSNNCALNFLTEDNLVNAFLEDREYEEEPRDNK